MHVRQFVMLTLVVAAVLSILTVATLPALTQTTGRQGQAQWQGQGQGQRQRGLGGADRLFDMLAQGGDTLAISSSGQLQADLEAFAREQGITSGSVTREQFALFSQQLTQKALGGNAADIKSALGDLRQKLGDLSTRNQDANGYRAQPWADMQGDWRDKLSQRLADNAAKSAANPNSPGPGWANDAAAALEDLDKRPVVFRAGKLPKGLPAWFAQLDTDHDGQIGLYEWRHSDKTIAEFQAMDRNGDGLLTTEEVLFFMTKLSSDVAKTTAAKSGSGSSGLTLQVDPPVPTPAPTWNTTGATGNNNAWKGRGNKGG